ncbi:unnamed protein product [Rhizoctonia solani]|uniref:BTB domain-containing protein n=1 Tax=Rhizoctonia solani TaxID=456999 RepID=A0A8H3A9J4_9AGAM|nr:unnamed protein product [Rhizoctonia solani]
MSLSPTMVLPGRSPANKKPPPPTKRHPEFYFDDTMLVIRVENRLFKVHKYMLLKSETFSDMFELPKGTALDPGEGSAPDNPIALDGVTGSDFEALLRVLYASHFSTNQLEPKSALIIPAFRLSNMWHFADLCAHLMPIAENMFSEVDKIIFAREFELDQWIIPAHIKLCQRNKPLNSEEAAKVGLRSLLFISRIREEILKSPSRQMDESVIRQKANAWIKRGCTFAA